VAESSRLIHLLDGGRILRGSGVADVVEWIE